MAKCRFCNDKHKHGIEKRTGKKVKPDLYIMGDSNHVTGRFHICPWCLKKILDEIKDIAKESVEESHLTICPHCKHKNKVGNQFCGKCGSSLYEDQF